MTRQKKQRRKRKLEVDDDQERSVKREAIATADEQMEVERDAVEDIATVDSLLPTRHMYAEQLMVLLKTNDIVLIDGDVGSGKTFMAKHIASLLQLDVRVMQMGDQLDSKGLMGSYECTEVAGQFKWKKSHFNEWLCAPGLIIIEDIDTGNADVITSLLNISSSRRMVLPTGDSVDLHPQCHLVATTQNTRLGGRRNGVLEGLHSRITLPPLTDEELKRLGKTIYPRISHIVKAICKIFRELESLPCGGNSRKLTSTDLMRALKRVNNIENLTSSQAILLELMDVWCICEPSKERRDTICSIMAPLLSLTTHEVESSLTMRTPILYVSEESVNVGRVTLDRRTFISTERSTKLGHTKGALQLLERMAMSVKMEEAVLLVGESGVGKTSLVQVLADMRGEKLTTVNLGPHSDTDDLITSLRPTSYGKLIEPFTRDFVHLFTRSFDTSKNEKFLHNLEVYLMHQRYDEYLRVVEETAKRILSKKKESEWADVVVRCRRLAEGMAKGASPFAVQRGMVKEAAEEGYWLLIDEINLAPPECLDAIVDALSGSHHPSFRLFACMNPATDTSKRRLPEGIRSRFIEYYVSEDSDASDLTKIVSSYLPSASVNSVDGIVKLYMEAKKKHPLKLSLRTLTRALIFAGDGRFATENRCLYEAFSMAFLSNMEGGDKDSMYNMIVGAFPCEKNSGMRKEKESSMMIEGYEIERGDCLPVEDKGYVITPTVKKNLKEVARIVSSKRLAVLLEGETSAGKTSIVVHLAKITGNVIRRINNHEQTDVQEYLGSYVPDSKGRLYFREGPLVEAVRKGYWVILDELNLAPSDVIETLNRLLDDNRELLIAESNELIKAHPRFRLFATQNPAGSYAGRKRLSRALLSRFVVLLFPILPLNELSVMVCARCQVAPSAAERMIRVLLELRLQRSLSGLFSCKDGLMTLRDVFRWGHRLSSDEGSDWQAAMIHHGYFLLAGRCRTEADKAAVVSTLEKVLKGNIDEKALFSSESPYFPRELSFDQVVLTFNMRRMLVLSWQALCRNEAVLIVGETGDGKTRLAQTIGGDTMMTINCHERTECSDLLGRLRPASNGGFEWQDGVVISAMKEGKILLMDEISLAEDSVLERLNPLFEEKRAILLTDSGAQAEEVVADDRFKVIATMNPGGDYGKKELSKALRNRFTEIWSCSSFDRSELCSIFAMRINNGIDTSVVMKTASIVIQWINDVYHKFSHALRVSPSVRDIVACADMWNALSGKGGKGGGISVERALLETVSCVFIDGIPCQMTRSVTNIMHIQEEARNMMASMVSMKTPPQSLRQLTSSEGGIEMDDLFLSFGPIPPKKPRGFSLCAPTCMENMYRVMRALYINKPILLEGSPGCGKSTLIMALASVAGYPITRLNLSEQTDLSDLFGSDVPIVDEEGKMTFEWKDGPILKAIKNGEWILLDEMNLASQSILEGLNACFDHRRVLYIAELAKEFEIPSTSNCRFFACQNPRGEGGSRRALPKSFVNRFTNIYTTDLTEDDELAILREMDYDIDDKILSGMVKVNGALSKVLWTGGPFSFNLRDINRWMLMISKTCDVGYSFETVYVNRLRLEMEKQRAREILKEITDIEAHSCPSTISIDEKTVRMGPLMIERRSSPMEPCALSILSSQSSTLLSLMNCLSNGWISLLIGPRNSGKRSMAEMAATLIGVPLEVICLSSDSDASELIGSFEQKVDEGSVSKLVESLSSLLSPYVLERDMERLKICTALEKIEREVELILISDGIPMEVKDTVRSQLVLSLRNEMYFEWVDSPFVRAYTQGKCLLIENVNQCNSAVLDRLNTSLEDGGSLVLTESRGDFNPIPPHADFRVILSMDSSEGEVSRAMRNRSVEIFMEEKKVWNEKERDVHTIIQTLSGKDCVSRELSNSLAGLPTRSILLYGLLLSQYEEGTVARLANRSIDQVMSNESMEMNRQPRLNEWNEVEKMSEWTMRLWKEASSGGDEEEEEMALPLLPLLASSTNMIRSDAIIKHVTTRGVRLIEAVRALIPSHSSNHPIDPSFHGDHNLTPLHSLSSRIVVEWLNVVSDEMKTEEGSALSISRSLSLYEMMASPFYFNKMESSEQIKRCVMDSLWSVIKRQDVHSESVFPLCLSILSLLHSLSRSLSIRTGDSAIRIAYSNLARLVECESKSLELIELEEWYVPHSIQSFLTRYNEERVVDPFTEKDQLERLKEIVMGMREKEECEERRDVSLFSLVSTIGRRMEKTLTLNTDTTHILLSNTLESDWMRVFDYLPWTNDDSCRKIAISCLLSMDISEGVSLSSLLYSSPVSLMISSVWQQLGWDSHMRCITVRNVRDLSLDSFLSQLWRIGANSRRITHTIQKSIESISDDEGNERNERNKKKSVGLLSYGLDVMEYALPPLSSLDPVIYGEEHGRIVKEQLRVVETLIHTLDKWRLSTGGQGHATDESSTHPFIKSLYRSRNELREQMKKVENGEERRAYREESKQYYAVCREMHSLYKSCRVLYELVKDEKWKETKDMELMSCRVESTRKTTKTFLEDSLIRFGSLMDVCGGLWMGVWIVYLSLNILRHEMTVHSTRLSLMSSIAFPRHLESASLSWLGSIRNSMVDWAIRASSPLPLDLQSALIEWKVSKGETGHIEIEWTRSQWMKWYEKNTTKENEKLFVYREKSMEEKEEMEMEEMFTGLEGMEGVLGEGTLLQLLHSFNKKKEKKKQVPFDGQKRLITAIAYLSSLCNQCGVEEKWKNAGLDASLYAFSSLSQSKESTVDVYRETSWNEVKEAIEECIKLNGETAALREKWPEIQSLSLIMDAIESLMDSSLSIGQMRMAEKLEKIIEEAEEWERLADRAHSLEKCMLPLRERLVRWKKMEIMSWNRLVEGVKKDCEDRAALVAFPLFDALLKDDTREETIVAMACDWISHSTLIDYQQRLRSVLCLAEWARVIGKEKMGEELESVVGYFGQIRGKVAKKLKEIVDPIERLMKDLVKIAQYKDLNLLSIKASSKKNHIQLFKLVRRLKNEGGSEIDALLDVTMDIGGWKEYEDRRKKDSLEESETEEREERGIVKRARQICDDIVKKRRERMESQSWMEMGETIEEVRRHCATRIEYSGEEKEMESQQGRERNWRQREVALIIKESQGLGVNSRRGMTLNAEDVSRNALTHLNASIDRRKNIVRALALARSILIRRGMKPNEQLSTSTRGHFLGMVEYGTHWLIDNEGNIDTWKGIEKEMERLEKGLNNETANNKSGYAPFNHRQAIETMERMEDISNQLHDMVLAMKMRLTTVPSIAPEESDVSWSALSRVCSSSEELPRVVKLVDQMENVCGRMCHLMEDLSLSRCDSTICLKSTIDSVSQLMESMIEEWMAMMETVEYWFHEESHVMHQLLSSISSLNKRVISECDVCDSFSLPTQQFLLFIQRLYKSSVERSEDWNGKDIDVLIMSSSTIKESKPDELTSIVSNALDRVSDGDQLENIQEVTRLLSIARILYGHCISIHERGSHGVGVMVHKLAELGIHLMEKGYLNTIPKEDKKEEGEGKEKDGEQGGGGGMGEGKGSKDVTEEMEETGQIEGLEGDEEEEDEGGDGGKGEKNDRPIEMEEDFAKDLQDVDKDGESGDEEGEDGEDGEEPPIDDALGDVEEKEEEEIDPHLWDDEDREENDDKTMDEDNKGADEHTGELAAQEDMNAETREDEKEEEKKEDGEGDKGEEGEEDMENMDMNEREKEEIESVEREDQEKKERDERGEEEEEDREQAMELGEDAVDGDENEENQEDEKGEDDEDGVNDDDVTEKMDEDEDEDDIKEKEESNAQLTEDVDNEENSQEEEGEEKKMDSGFGGANNEDEKEEGGQGDNNDEDMERKEEEEGENGNDDSDRRKEGRRDNMGTKKEENEKKEKEDNVDDNEEGEEKRRELMMNDEKEEKKMEEESEIVDGADEENGDERKESMNRQENERMMTGGGTMEEAKESMKRRKDDTNRDKKRKEKIEVSAGDVEVEEGDDNGDDTVINFNPLDLMTLTEKLTKELIMGAKKEVDEIHEVNEKKEKKEKTDEELDQCRVEWERMAPVVSLLAAELSENLRLILEPRLATRMEGDYRSGKRLNMKKIIPYIASHYRKNRIWMRRTKKAERNYQVLIAVDDSASMAENGMESLTCQGVCIVEEALRRVNAGQLSVMTFGETIQQLIPFAHASSTQSTGESLLSSLSFNQSSTDMCGMLRQASILLEEVATPKNEQMLIIISDGRGALAHGVDKIRDELARLSRVSVLFVILDSGKKSIKDMKVASFVDNQVQLIPYLSLFPFPLYVLAQSVTQIPSLLAEALRQWIEYGSQQ